MNTKKPDKSRNTFPLSPEQDPIVEILRLAYRRGLAIQREQAQKAALTEQKDPDGQQSIASDDAEIRHEEQP
jgi:hypothetical protein